MSRTLRPGAFAWLLLAASALAPAPAAAAPGAEPDAPATAEAAQRYKQGIKLYEDGDYAASLAEFRRAYALVPAFQVLFNLARVHRQMQNYVEAQRHFERYLHEGGRRVPRARADEVRRELDELRRRVARLEVRCDEPGVEIFVDDESVGTTPLAEPVLANAGRRRLSAVKPRFETFRATLEVVGAETRVVEIALVASAPASAAAPAAGGPAAPAALAAPAAPAAPANGARAGGWGTPIWLGFGAAGVLAAGAIATGVVSYVHAADARDQAAEGPVGPSYDGERRGAERWALANDLLAGAALVTAGVSLVVPLTSSRPPAQAAWGVGPGGLVARGRF
ncbi:MAG TPA: tetratricopeptide repeat protein [Polyangiaceae bacterium]|nr:tetratricopeptide repeat protein [Polyangiaceae bacterium]